MRERPGGLRGREKVQTKSDRITADEEGGKSVNVSVSEEFSSSDAI